jgi:hypothetical protein
MEDATGNVAERGATDRPLHKMTLPLARGRLLPELSPGQDRVARRRHCALTGRARRNGAALSQDCRSLPILSLDDHMGARVGAPYRCDERSKGWIG